MKKPAKKELLSRILISSSVFILGSPLITQAIVSVPAVAETISTSTTEEVTRSTNEFISEQQEGIVEQATGEETVDSETQVVESTGEHGASESSQASEDQVEPSTEQMTESSSEPEAAESSTTSDEESKTKVAEAENILWSGNWGTAPATLDIEGVLTVGAGTLTTAVDQVIPLTEELKNMVIKKVILTAPVILPADVAGLFESYSHYGTVPSQLNEIVGLTYLDTSQATTMNSMFYGYSGSTLDLSNFDSTGVINSLGAGMNQFLANVRYLRELTLGPKFSFVGWNNWPGNSYPVNLVDPSGMYGWNSSYYTGYWQNVGTGTIDAPYGDNVLKSEELVLIYDGTTMADTYVWQPRFIEGAPVTVNYLDEEGNELLPPNVLTGGNIGDSIEVVPEEIPNYTLKEVQGEEKIVFSNVPQTVTYIYSPKIESNEERKIVARVIHYLHEDGTEAAPDKVDTVEFTREVRTNLATGEETFGEWQARDDDTIFDLVKSPEIVNYYADREFIDEVIDVKADSEDIEEFVMYSPKMVESTETKEVKRMIHYVYGDGKEAAPDSVDTVTFTRTVTTNEATGKNTYGEWQAQDDDTMFDEVLSPEIDKYNADQKMVDKVTDLTAESEDFEITVTYSPNMIESTETKEVKRMIHYVYEDGKEAAPDSVDTVTFTRTVTTNEATGKNTYGEWQAQDDDTMFDEVLSPEIDKYNADQKMVEKVTELTAESEDREVTVTYSPNMIESTETKEVNQTIHYVYGDGKEAAPDKTDTVTFTRTVTINEATGDKTFGEWQAKDDDTKFDEVKSPEIKNYHADKTSIEEVTGLTAEDKDREVTVTYSPNMTESTETKEVKRMIHFVYEDGKEAAPDKVDTVTFTRTVTTNEATGNKTYGEWQAQDDDTMFDEVLSPEIDKYNADQKTVDKVTGLTAESEDREVTVTYSPNMIESTETKEVKQTVHYVYEDGKEAAPDKVDTVTFTRTVTANEATGDKTYGEWQAQDDDTTFDEVKSPEIKNYHADKATVEEVTGLTEKSENREVTITYSPNMTETTETKEVKQTIHYMYEDGKEAAPDKVDTVTFTRTVTANEATGDKTCGEWQAKGDDTTFDEVKSPEIKNYHADKTSIEKVTGLTAKDKDREVTVTYSPNMTESTETKEVKQTVHYVYEDGKEAAPDKVDTVTFTRTVTTNEATGDKIYGEWQAKENDTTFDEVKSPEIKNYTVDKETIEAVTGVAVDNQDIEVTVTYVPKMETATETEEVKQTIHYVYEDGSKAADDHTDKVTFTRVIAKNLATGVVTYGEWKAKDNDTTFAEISSPMIEYCTPDNELIEAITNIQPDAKDTELTVIYKANTETKEESKEVSRTIHYVYEDGSQAAESYTETLTYTRTETTNLLTGEVAYSDWAATNGDTTFDEVKSKQIEGYTADLTTVKEQTGMTAEDEDTELTVTYIKNATDEANPTDSSKESSNTPNDQTKTDDNTPSTDMKIATNVSETTRTVTSEKSLPKTGEKEEPFILYAGVTMAVSSLLAFFLRRLRQKRK
ncbi:mucin-binding protein [Enterococcus sp. AZ173]|uniref:mucin-binding protein n=1 Tax=Enterococcus sp. AZ173 TaxID=2774700 RepID=UPI003D2E07F9